MKLLMPFLVATLLSACAGFSTEPPVPVALIKERTGVDVSGTDRERLNDQIHQLLVPVLDIDTATQIALLNNPGLRASYAGAGIAEADLVQAGLPQNPGFTFNHTSNGAGTVIDRTWSIGLISFLTAPLATRIERSHLEQIKLQIADQALQLAAQTRSAYVEAVSAQQNLDYARQVTQAAGAGAELADSMQASGNWSVLEQQREQLFFAQSQASLTQAGTDSLEKREALSRLLGLSGPDLNYRLPEQLPDIPAQPFAPGDVEAVAMAQRLDIQASLIETRRIADEQQLTSATGVINILDVGPAFNSSSGQVGASGYQISINVPLFDWGQARSKRAEALYMQSVERATETAVNARSQVRLAYQSYQHSYRLARQYREQIMPLQKKISAEILLRYNGMLISVFDLLADARNQVAAVNASATALKNFWIADARLQAALGGTLTNKTQGADR